MEERLLFVDTETGGLDPARHSLLSLGMVVWENGKIGDAVEVLVNDGKLSATAEALSVNGIDLERHRQQALSPSQAMEQLLRFINRQFPRQRKITLAGHNVQFDINFLTRFFSGNKTDFSSYFSHRMIDTSSILHYLYLAGRLKHRAISSDKAFALFEIRVERRHTALGDAIATAQLFTKLVDFLR